MNQVIIAFHVQAHGEIRLSPELAEYKLFEPGSWTSGAGRQAPAIALGATGCVRRRGIEPRYFDWGERAKPPSAL